MLPKEEVTEGIWAHSMYPKKETNLYISEMARFKRDNPTFLLVHIQWLDINLTFYCLQQLFPARDP